MKILLQKFGTMLVSRQTGSEAYKAMQPLLADLPAGEVVEIDFTGVITFSPSWGDEVLANLYKQFGDRMVLLLTDNPSVLASLETLEQVYGHPFPVSKS
jgi:hypothetical protein